MRCRRESFAFLRRHLAAFEIGIAVALGALLAPVEGAGRGAALCKDTAPWILQDALDAGAQPWARAITADAPALDVATYNLHSGLGLHHAFYRSRVDVE